jgi:LysM repeat protein
MHLPSKLTLLVLGSLVVAIAAAIELTRRRVPDAILSPHPDLDTAVLPPNLARDPFLAAAPNPAPIVAPRPSVKVEAFVAVIAVSAYIAVFGMSLFGGNDLPDLLSIRAGGSSSSAFAADVLGAQTTPSAVAAAFVDSAPPVTATPDPAPTDAPALAAEPEPEPADEAPMQHTLRSGETLTSVAALYGTTASDLAAANDLTGSLIYAGQVLEIPTR